MFFLSDCLLNKSSFKRLSKCRYCKEGRGKARKHGPKENREVGKGGRAGGGQGDREGSEAEPDYTVPSGPFQLLLPPSPGAFPRAQQGLAGLQCFGAGGQVPSQPLTTRGPALQAPAWPPGGTLQHRTGTSPGPGLGCEVDPRPLPLAPCPFPFAGPPGKSPARGVRGLRLRPQGAQGSAAGADRLTHAPQPQAQPQRHL